jgi:hypothetical protein
MVAMPVIPAFRRLRQEDCEFKASLGYIVRPCLKKKNPEKKFRSVISWPCSHTPSFFLKLGLPLSASSWAWGRPKPGAYENVKEAQNEEGQQG